MRFSVLGLRSDLRIELQAPVHALKTTKRLFLAIFDPRSSIVKNVFDCHLTGVMNKV